MSAKYREGMAGKCDPVVMSETTRKMLTGAHGRQGLSYEPTGGCRVTVLIEKFHIRNAEFLLLKRKFVLRSYMYKLDSHRE